MHKFNISSRINRAAYNKIICNPLNDKNKRFLLGKKGTAELLAIGLNPSTANEAQLDPTSRNIEKIANKNGCDGWWLVNLYPKRTSKPTNLPKKPNAKLTQENLFFIENLFQDPNFNIVKALCCWGNHVKDHAYLELQAAKIQECIESHGINFYCIGTTKSGNPFHPSPMAVNVFLGGIDQLKLIDYS